MGSKRKSEIAVRFKALRKRTLLTQARLGELVGIGRQAVSEIERGKANPHYSTVQRFADLEMRHMAALPRVG